NSVVVTVDEVAGVNELDMQLLNLYPNPNNGIFELEVDGLKVDKVICKLFNIQGQLVSEFSLDLVNGKVNKTIEMSKKLAAGTYYLGLYENDKALIKQFIKQ
ncbi:MAG: T9SS type A sorting domain-containing protein, partial [Bacteroidetes bacterium]|nr:T9SS type A sorting domain-containing protein [Bacteroidota bacterium]